MLSCIWCIKQEVKVRKSSRVIFWTWSCKQRWQSRGHLGRYCREWNKSFWIKHACFIWIMSCVEQGFTFKSSSSILVVGPSNCGKTTFLKRLLLENEDLLTTPSRRIVYCYGSWQLTFDILKKEGVTFHEGVPTHEQLKEWFGDKKGGLLILDDLMAEGGDNKDILNLFTQYLHHMNVTVFYLCQDMFPRWKYAKTISRNAQYIVAFKHPRDQVALHTLFKCIPWLGKTRWSNITHVRNVPSVIYCWIYILLLQTIEDYWVTYWNTKVVSVATER